MANKSFEEEDPLELVGMIIPGGPDDMDTMARAIVEEYLWLGWTETRLMALFTNPMFQITHRVFLERGEFYVSTLIRQVCDEWQIPLKES
ncbi:MAG: hypothetical protein HYZ26_09615 [Chloroflexi bacterium]|nr:hypothetical protein [Chloroflexota bacterium]